MRNKFKILVCAFLMVCVCFASNVVNANAEKELDLERLGIKLGSVEETETQDGFRYDLTVYTSWPMWLVKSIFESDGEISSVESFSTYGDGDVNKDGDVDACDYVLIKRLCMNTYKGVISQLGSSDFNGDGEVGARDYMLIKRYVLGTYKIPE